MQNLLVASVAGAMLALAAPAALAQMPVSGSSSSAAQPAVRAGTSTLRVTVADQTGAIIPAARVEVLDRDGGRVAMLTNHVGEAAFDGLAAGRYTIRAAFDGFETVENPDVRVRGRGTHREIRLPIARVADEVTVARDRQEAKTDPRGDAFSTVLTPEQIAQLPDDPDELEAALNAMAGPGAVMRVNGFRGGRLPPKSQIQEIRFRRNFFAAENHEVGFMAVDIRTRPGTGAFRGSLDFGFRDESLNARNAFAPRKGEEQQRRLMLSLEGPIWKDRTSFAFSTDGLDAFDSKTIVAALIDGAFNDVVERPNERINFSARLEHALSRTHALRAEVQRGDTENRNLGVGDFDLPERGYTRTVDSRLFRVSESGPIGSRLFNELRFQVDWIDTEWSPLLEAPAVQVLNAFASGGAQISGVRRSREIEVADNIDINAGRHAMRAGFLVEAAEYESTESRNANGVFTFASLDAFRAGKPTTYTERRGDPLVAFTQTQAGWYFQDDIRARKDLTLSLGLRHEFQSHLEDWLNIAPRAGFAWSPFRNGGVTVRGGAGIFYDWYGSETYEQAQRVDGTAQQDLVVRNPGYPDPFAGGPLTVLPAGRIETAPDLRMPTVFQASIGVERQLTPSSLFNVVFSETRGWNELRARNINAPIDGVRPDPTAGTITQIESTAESRRRSVMAHLNLNVPSRQLFLATMYMLSWSKNETDGPLSLPVDNYDLSGEWGPAPSDIRHRVGGMFSMALWRELRVSTLFRANTAPPYTITTGFDDNGDTVSNDRPEGVARNSVRGKGLWDVSARVQYSFGFGRRPPTGSSGTPTIRIVRAGGDDTPMGGFLRGGASDNLIRVDLYVGVSNVFNAVNYSNFSGVMTSPFFGQPTSAQPGRRMEVGARVAF